MGLDMYLVKRSNNDGQWKHASLGYWRKHNALHNWMYKLAIAKGVVGNIDDFNCARLPLCEVDLDTLADDIKQRKLEPTDGFFWGGTDYTEEDWQAHEIEDLEIIESARTSIRNGDHVFYIADW